jgi:hypothetical protein
MQAATRLVYDDLKSRIDLVIQPLEELFDVEL